MDPKFITTDRGDELVLLARRDYDALLARADGPTEEEEDEGTARVIARSDAAIAAGRELLLPAEVAEPLMRGENPLRAVRSWRGLTQAQLAERVGFEQGYISVLERELRTGSVDAYRKLAAALDVPLDVLLGD